MKAIITIVASVLFFASVGGKTIESQAVNLAPTWDYEIAGSSEALVGTWYSFPAGLLLRFNGNGSADFGLDESGNAVGYDADASFEGTKLFIRYTDYDGENEVCETAVGIYEVHVLENGCVKFVPVQDECSSRSDILNGHPDLGFDLLFHPVE